MTARYLGMNRRDGLTVTDLEHISQSIGDILRTPVGSRVMRRDYGSLRSEERRVGKECRSRWSPYH